MNNKGIAFIVLLFLTVFTYLANAQQPDLQQKITLKVYQQPLSEVLKILQERYKIQVSYSPQQIPLDKKISINLRKQPIQKVLNEIALQSSIEFKMVEGQLVLKPSAKLDVINEPIIIQPQKFTLSGYLKDSLTGEVLIGAAIYDRKLRVGAITNAYGFFSLTLPEGEHELLFSYIGYQQQLKSIELKKNIRLDLWMGFAQSSLAEIVVKSNNEEQLIESEQISQMKIMAKNMEFTPALFGDVDFIKWLNTMPGIKGYGDGSAFMYVRGGEKDQNLMLVDEAMVYNPAHLLGFFSSVSPDAINDVQVYKGDIPVWHGGRLSSLIQVHTKDGNMKRFSVYGNYGIITSNYTVEGPIIRDKWSFLLSFRRSHINWAFQKNNPGFKMQFYDFNVKTNATLNKNNRIYLSHYGGKDFIGNASHPVSRNGISWQNRATTLRWNHIFSSRWFMNTTVHTSNYAYWLYVAQNDAHYWKTETSNFSIKNDVNFYINPKNTLRFGLGLSSYYYNPGNLSEAFVEAFNWEPVLSHRYVNEQALYIGNEQKPHQKWLIKYGIRFPVWSNVGPATIYKFDKDYISIDTLMYNKNEKFHTITNAEPRISISFAPDSRNMYRAAYSRTTQCNHLLLNSVSPFTSLEVWLPSGPNIPAQYADQFVLGYNRTFQDNLYNIGVEGYYKKMHNQIEYAEHAPMIFNPLLEGQLRFGEAWSYGAEVMLKKNIGIFTGFISYCYFRTFRQTDGINEGKTFPAFQDRPHDFTVFTNYRLRERLNLSANWSYYTGSAVTLPTGFFYYNNYSIPLYTEKNNARLPDYHRLDVALNFRLNKKVRKFQHSLLLTIVNVYNRKNPFSINFNKMLYEGDKMRVPADHYQEEMLHPSQIALMGRVPSLTYYFKFN